MNRHDIAQKASSVFTRLTTPTAMVCALLGLGAGAATAGSLTPPGPPAPTMRTLEQQKPTWDKIIPGTQRFVDALNGSAALDKETGLVWDKTPDFTFQRSWIGAMNSCYSLYAGGRYGWRLPTTDELTSLIDGLYEGQTTLPKPMITFWSSSTSFDVSGDYAWSVSWDGVIHYESKSLQKPVWCVRGGH